MANGIPVTKSTKTKNRNAAASANGASQSNVAWGGMGLSRPTTTKPQSGMPGQAGSSGQPLIPGQVGLTSQPTGQASGPVHQVVPQPTFSDSTTTSESPVFSEQAK